MPNETQATYNGPSLATYNVSVDSTASGLVQLTKQAVSTDGSDALVPANTTQGLLVSTWSATASNPTAVPDSASAGQIVPANTSRRGLIIVNASTAWLYLSYGYASVTTSLYSEAIPPYATYRMSDCIYTGIIYGIWSADAGGNAIYTDFS